jgi:hypothetical protein
MELGPGQMAMVGFGKYATPAFDFGVQKDVVIPRSIKPVAVDFKSIGTGMIQATISAPQGGDLRLIMQQYFTDGSLIRMWPTGLPNVENMGKLFCSKQSGKELPIREDYNREVWAGLSWAVDEASQKDMKPGVPLTLTFKSMDKGSVTLKGRLYPVNY